MLVQFDPTCPCKVRRFGFDHMKKLFASIDVIVSPTLPFVAPRYTEDVFLYGESNSPTTSASMKYDLKRHTSTPTSVSGSGTCRFMFLANFLGLPAVSVPAGASPEGLPIGVQVFFNM